MISLKSQDAFKNNPGKNCLPVLKWYAMRTQNLQASKWIFLSPHLDDVVLSCGGLIYDLSQKDTCIEIWTLCAGDPDPQLIPEFAWQLHQRWQTGANAVGIRRAEDKASCQWINARPVHLGFQDCIYRRNPDTGEAIIQQNEDLFTPLSADEAYLVIEVQNFLERNLPGDAQLVLPLGLGSHKDHELTRLAAERLARNLYYYADYPYALLPEAQIDKFLPNPYEFFTVPISSAGLAAWQNAVGEHKSQISTFWGSLEDMKTKIFQYWSTGGGNGLWYTTSPADNKIVNI